MNQKLIKIGYVVRHSFNVMREDPSARSFALDFGVALLAFIVFEAISPTFGLLLIPPLALIATGIAYAAFFPFAIVTRALLESKRQLESCEWDYEWLAGEGVNTHEPSICMACMQERIDRLSKFVERFDKADKNESEIVRDQ
ncbi:unnamed protein product, partial [Symbiodinium sp. KB8]